MAKVCIVREDVEKGVEASINEVIDRYASLTQTSHELSIVFNKSVIGDYFGEFPDGNLMKRLIEVGFKKENISYRNMTSEIGQFPAADVYFCDATVPEPEWNPNCFRIADELGKNKVYINNSNCAIVNSGEAQGYRILRDQKIQSEDLERILEGNK